MNPLAVYHEKRFDGRRRYLLFPDHVVVSGNRTFTSEFEVEVPLARLHPSYSRARVRNGLFAFGLLIIAVGGVGILAFLATQRGLSYDDFWAILWVALLVAGVTICAATLRKTPYLIFMNEGGQSVLGLVERDDPQLRSFISALSNQITVSKSQTANAG